MYAVSTLVPNQSSKVSPTGFEPPKDSIETESNTNTKSIEQIPQEIDDLIDNKMFRNKFRSLISRGFLAELTQLAEIAKSKSKPSFWFATVTAKKNWDRTVDFLRKLNEVASNAAEVIRRVKVPAGSARAVYWACWKLGSTVIGAAVTAQETGKNPFALLMHIAKGHDPSVSRT